MLSRFQVQIQSCCQGASVATLHAASASLLALSKLGISSPTFCPVPGSPLGAIGLNSPMRLRAIWRGVYLGGALILLQTGCRTRSTLAAARAVRLTSGLNFVSLAGSPARSTTDWDLRPNIVNCTHTGDDARSPSAGNQRTEIRFASLFSGPDQGGGPTRISRAPVRDGSCEMDWRAFREGHAP